MARHFLLGPARMIGAQSTNDRVSFRLYTPLGQARATGLFRPAATLRCRWHHPGSCRSEHAGCRAAPGDHLPEVDRVGDGQATTQSSGRIAELSGGFGRWTGSSSHKAMSRRAGIRRRCHRRALFPMSLLGAATRRSAGGTGGSDAPRRLRRSSRTEGRGISADGCPAEVGTGLGRCPREWGVVRGTVRRREGAGGTSHH